MSLQNAGVQAGTDRKPRLYTSPSAFPNPQRLRLFLHEKGIAGEVEELVFDAAPAGGRLGWRHLRRNPWGETPTLELVDGTVLAETAAIVRFLDETYPGRRMTGNTPLEQGLDAMWDSRILVQILHRITTMFQVMQEGLAPTLTPNLEGSGNTAWGRRCRREALAHAALVDRHFADGRQWLLGGADPSFADITLCTAIAFSKFPVNATPLDEQFERLGGFWSRWKRRESFRQAYADGGSGLVELDYLTT